MFNDLDGVQMEIMRFIKKWANREKTPIPRKVIVNSLIAKGNNSYTVVYSLSSLVLKGYLRRAYTERQNETRYIMIRNVPDA